MPRVGLYEAEEEPRRCPKCHSTNSKAVKVWVHETIRHRHRTCRDCGRIFATCTQLSRDSYLLQKREAFIQ